MKSRIQTTRLEMNDRIGFQWPPCDLRGLRVIALCAAKTLVMAAALSAQSAIAQRAETYDKRVKQYVVHDAPRIRIDNVRVIDGTGAPARAGQSILIRDGRIERIAATEALAGDAADTIIDGKGRTVVPGLV